MAFALKTTGSKAIRAQTARKSVVVKALAPTTKVCSKHVSTLSTMNLMSYSFSPLCSMMRS